MKYYAVIIWFLFDWVKNIISQVFVFCHLPCWLSWPLTRTIGIIGFFGSQNAASLIAQGETQSLEWMWHNLDFSMLFPSQLNVRKSWQQHKCKYMQNNFNWIDSLFWVQTISFQFNPIQAVNSIPINMYWQWVIKVKVNTNFARLGFVAILEDKNNSPVALYLNKIKWKSNSIVERRNPKWLINENRSEVKTKS